jgi:hypothetical protein
VPRGRRRRARRGAGRGPLLKRLGVDPAAVLAGEAAALRLHEGPPAVAQVGAELDLALGLEVDPRDAGRRSLRKIDRADNFKSIRLLDCIGQRETNNFKSRRS